MPVLGPLRRDAGTFGAVASSSRGLPEAQRGLRFLVEKGGEGLHLLGQGLDARRTGHRSVDSSNRVDRAFAARLPRITSAARVSKTYQDSLYLTRPVAGAELHDRTHLDTFG